MGGLEQAQAGTRRLRRAVAELSECAIEDIESIWSALSDAERARLRPLLASTPYLRESGLAALDTVDAPAISPRSDAPTLPGASQRLARIAAVLPSELTSRLLAGLDQRTREAVIEALPVEQRPAPAQADRSYDITKNAGAALRMAALAASEQIDALPKVHDPATTTLGHKIRRWLERRA